MGIEAGTPWKFGFLLTGCAEPASALPHRNIPASLDHGSVIKGKLLQRGVASSFVPSAIIQVMAALADAS